MRCGLTFLPIREPGISKCCELCSQEFLDNIWPRDDSGSGSNLTNVTQPATNMQRSIVVEQGMDEQHAVDHFEVNGNSKDQKSGFAESLFFLFDVCPYCQGKYVG